MSYSRHRRCYLGNYYCYYYYYYYCCCCHYYYHYYYSYYHYYYSYYHYYYHYHYYYYHHRRHFRLGLLGVHNSETSRNEWWRNYSFASWSPWTFTASAYKRTGFHTLSRKILL
jgi:hypothetical protein